MPEKEIRKHLRIDEGRLRREDYLQTLLAEGVSAGLLDGADAEAVQIGCLEQVASLIQRKTDGETCAVPEEDAQEILRSVVYLVGLGLQTYPDADEAALALRRLPLREQYGKGRAEAARAVRETRELVRRAQETQIETDCIAYRQVLERDLPAFFHAYDLEFAADDGKFLPSYPLFAPVRSEIGPFYPRAYAEKLWFENRLCALFPPSDVREVLFRCGADGQDTAVNLLYCVLTAACGAWILRGNADSIVLTDADVHTLFTISPGRSPDEVCEGLVASLGLPDDPNDPFRQYCLSCARTVARTLCGGTLPEPVFRSLFFASDGNCDAHGARFHTAARMADADYRELLGSLELARNPAERAETVRKSVRSLGDLADLLVDAFWSTKELHALFSTLDDLSLAALLADAEAPYHARLADWLAAQPAERRDRVNGIAENLDASPF